MERHHYIELTPRVIGNEQHRVFAEFAGGKVREGREANRHTGDLGSLEVYFKLEYFRQVKLTGDLSDFDFTHFIKDENGDPEITDGLHWKLVALVKAVVTTDYNNRLSRTSLQRVKSQIKKIVDGEEFLDQNPAFFDPTKVINEAFFMSKLSQKLITMQGYVDGDTANVPINMAMIPWYSTDEKFHREDVLMYHVLGHDQAGLLTDPKFHEQILRGVNSFQINWNAPLVNE